ncbi:MAG: hypothetical protein QM831_22345 [Kofleriaceae bacterium]
MKKVGASMAPILGTGVPSRHSSGRLRQMFVCLFWIRLPVVIASGCGASQPAPAEAPSGSLVHVRTQQALAADGLFWATLRAGNFDGIEAALQATTAAYLADPGDAITTAHVGWLHIWRIAERARLEHVSPTIVDETTLASDYFDRAVRLAPSEPRYLGFLASSLLAQGKIHHDADLTHRGSEVMRGAVDAWPAFNLFTSGYTLAGEPRDSTEFALGLSQEWRNLEVCSGLHINPAHPDFDAVFAAQERRRIAGMGRDARACLNSEIAPYNMEGFMLNLGDMLAKNGQVELATQAYAATRRVSDYGTWPYREILETRLNDVPAVARQFNADRDKTMMFRSAFACAGCHEAARP